MSNEAKYICLIVLAPDSMANICKKAAQHFHSAVSKVFDRVKSVALWSANIRKLAKHHKGYGSAANDECTAGLIDPRLHFVKCMISL